MAQSNPKPKSPMKTKSASHSAFSTTRLLLGLLFCSIGVVLALVAFAIYPGGTVKAAQDQRSCQTSHNKSRLGAPIIMTFLRLCAISL